MGERGPRRWLVVAGALAALAIGAVGFGLITALAGSNRDGEGDGSEAADAPTGAERVTRGRPEGALWEGRGSRIAQVRRGSRVTLHARPRGPTVRRLGDSSEFGSPRAFSVVSRRGRWLEVLSEAIPPDRTAWVRADHDRLRFRTTPWSIHASLTERIVELRQNGEVMHSFEVTIGAAGTETPSGRFAVTDTIVGGLNPVYGCCAIALTARQADLPEGWIGGDRVALHGTDGPLGAASSNGCLRARNVDVRTLIEVIPAGTPFVIEA